MEYIARRILSRWKKATGPNHVFGRTSRDDDWKACALSFPQAVLCAQCLSYLSTFDRTAENRDNRPLHDSLDSFRGAVDAGCHICFALWRQLTEAQLLSLANRPWWGAVVDVSTIAPHASAKHDEYVIDVSTHPPSEDRRAISQRFRLHSLAGEVTIPVILPKLYSVLQADTLIRRAQPLLS